MNMFLRISWDGWCLWPPGLSGTKNEAHSTKSKPGFHVFPALAKPYQKRAEGTAGKFIVSPTLPEKKH